MRSAASAILRKDLRLELRTGETVPAMALFTVTAFVLFHFGLQRGELDGELAAGVLLVTLLLASVLGVTRLFAAEQEEGGLDAFLLSPADRTALLVAKATALFLFLVAVELVAVPVFAVLLLGPGPDATAYLELAGVLALLDLGLAIVGTLVSALAAQTRARELIAPIIGLPLLIPALIAAARMVAPLLAAGAPGAVPGRWLAVLGLYDSVFALLAYALFDFLLED
jgi:heme exporter protein B